MNRHGILFVLSGPSGAGKGTVLRNVFEQIDNLGFSISVTTRKPRPGEINGVNYLFKSRNEFRKMVLNDEFLEHVSKFGNRYGTLKKTVNDMLEAGTDVVLEIETIGAQNVKEMYKDAVLIFITPSNPEEISKRLHGRNTEDNKNQEKRLKIGHEEMESISIYDYLAINDDLFTCVDEVISIIRAERAKISNNKHLVERLLNDNYYIKKVKEN